MENVLESFLTVMNGSDAQVKMRVQLAKYLYADLVKTCDAEKLDDLIRIIIELTQKTTFVLDEVKNDRSGSATTPSKVTVIGGIRLDENSWIRDFYLFLITECGLREITAKDYIRKLLQLFEREGLSPYEPHDRDAILELMDKYCEKDTEDGRYNAKLHGVILSVLKYLLMYLDRIEH